MNPNVIPIQTGQDECQLLKATVKGVSTQSLMIELDVGVMNARTAFSCLVAPIVGDSVLVNRSGNDYFVLSVLERHTDQNMTLAFPASVKMTASKGQMDFSASSDINLLSTSTTRLLAQQISMASADLTLNTGKLSANATDIESHSQTAKLYTHMLSTVAKQMSQKTEVLIRWVEKVETLNIGNLIQNIRQNYTSHANQAVITASKDMRIDAERIHMG
jgi:hypothetical protein